MQMGCGKVLLFDHTQQVHMNVITVIQLSPEVPGINVLLNTLNHNKNLMEFCKHVRLKFKEHVLTLL